MIKHEFFKSMFQPAHLHAVTREFANAASLPIKTLKPHVGTREVRVTNSSKQDFRLLPRYTRR